MQHKLLLLASDLLIHFNAHENCAGDPQNLGIVKWISNIVKLLNQGANIYKNKSCEKILIRCVPLFETPN